MKMQAQLSKTFALSSEFEAFRMKVASADQAREERNEVFK
jgi:hypothetical protein